MGLFSVPPSNEPQQHETDQMYHHATAGNDDEQRHTFSSVTSAQTHTAPGLHSQRVHSASITPQPPSFENDPSAHRPYFADTANGRHSDSTTRPPPLNSFYRDRPRKAPVEEEEDTVKQQRVARPLNSFFIFSKELRPLIQHTFPHLDNKGISRVLGDEWARLSAEDKAEYARKAEQLAEVHRSMHPDYKFKRGIKRPRNDDEAAYQGGEAPTPFTEGVPYAPLMLGSSPEPQPVTDHVSPSDTHRPSDITLIDMNPRLRQTHERFFHRPRPGKLPQLQPVVSRAADTSTAFPRSRLLSDRAPSPDHATPPALLTAPPSQYAFTPIPRNDHATRGTDTSLLRGDSEQLYQPTRSTELFDLGPKPHVHVQQLQQAAWLRSQAYTGPPPSYHTVMSARRPRVVPAPPPYPGLASRPPPPSYSQAISDAMRMHRRPPAYAVPKP